MPRGLIKDNGMDNCVELCEKNEENDGTLGQYCYLSLIVPLNFTNVTDGITSDKVSMNVVTAPFISYRTRCSATLFITRVTDKSQIVITAR